VNEHDLLLLAQARADAKSGHARETRLAAGVSQAEIARTCGVAPAAVSLWESGQRVPRGQAAVRYGRVLHMLACGNTRREAA
jgi:DNA-binding transcriptional regulator YiaG